MPEQELTKAGVVEAVAAAIGEAANVRLGVGGCLACGIHSSEPEPVRAFAVSNEKARDVLWRALQDWRPGTGWRIFQQPGTNQYMLNLTYTAPPEPVPTSTNSLPLGFPPAPTVSPPRSDCNPASCRPSAAR